MTGTDEMDESTEGDWKTGAAAQHVVQIPYIQVYDEGKGLIRSIIQICSNIELRLFLLKNYNELYKTFIRIPNVSLILINA